MSAARAFAVVLVSAIMLALVAVDAQAAPSTVHTKTIKPGHTWTISDPASMNVTGMRSSGRKLYPAGNADGSVRRYRMLRCPVICPVLAVWQLERARVLVPRWSPHPVQVTYRRWSFGA